MLGVSSSVLGTVGHYLSRILVTTAAALLIYAAAKLTRKIFRVRVPLRKPFSSSRCLASSVDLYNTFASVFIDI